MTRQRTIGIAVLASATVTNAFVPPETSSRMAYMTSTYRRRPLVPSGRGYSNTEDNTNDRFIAQEPIDPVSPQSQDQNLKLLFNNEAINIDDIAPTPTNFGAELLQSSDIMDTTAQELFAENAAILSAGGDESIDLGFDIQVSSSDIESTTDAGSDGLVNEDLKAVLAASGEAAAAAEASIPPELAEVLGELNTTADKSVEKLDVSPAIETDETTTEVAISTPSVGKILKFAIPAIGVWLCSPLLSLIDTSAVGVLSGTVQQAALSPAVAVTDYAALLIAFLYTGTTNMVATAQESDRGTVDKPRTAKMMIGAMQMSTYVGVGLGAILFAFARPLLRAIIGNDAISPAVFAAAMKYVRIRAIGMPAAAILGSTQAACLGMQDIRSPLYVLAAAAVVNFLGDMLFVGHSHPLIGGTAGAAWATVFSQYVAVAFFIRWLCGKAAQKATTEPSEVMNLSDAILEITGKSNDNDGNGKSRLQRFKDGMESLKLHNQRRKNMEHKSELFQEKKRSLLGKSFQRKDKSVKKTNSDSFSTRSFLNNRFSTKDLLKIPSKETREEFKPYVIPVTTTQVGRVSGYIAMAHVVASSLGTVSMAAQQVIVSIFYCLCPIADSLSLTAQSFVPAISEKKASTEKAAAMKKVLVNFLKAGAVFGGAMMAGVSGIPLLTGFFTSDQAVIHLVNSVVPLLLVFFGMHGFVCGTEGILLGQKDLGYLGKMYAAFFAAVPFMMLRVKRKALAGVANIGLTNVWTVFIGYQLARCALWLGRGALLQRRTDNAAKLATSATTNALAP
jgi:Na+-driven multidrug efflux pump